MSRSLKITNVLSRVWLVINLDDENLLLKRCQKFTKYRELISMTSVIKTTIMLDRSWVDDLI